MSTETTQPSAETIAEFHRNVATELFSQVLSLLERKDRTCAENDRMIHAAHASRFHWDFGGNPINHGLGEWQCSRVHTAMRQADAALYHAWRYLEIAETYELGIFHEAYAHTALAAAFALKSPDESKRHIERARELSAEVPDPEGQKLLASEIAAIENAEAATA